MFEWWEGLTVLQRVFYYCAIPSTLLLIIQTALTIIGLGGDSDVDSPGDMDGGIDLDGDGEIDIPDDMDAEVDDLDGAAGLRFFTVRGVVAFFTLFGWVGVVLSGKNMATPLVIIIAFLCGILGMFVTAYLFYSITKLQYSGNLNVKNAIGKVGQVYIPVPGKMSGKGKIHINIQDTLTELDAMTEEDEKIKTGTMVIVTDIEEDGTLIVEQRK